MRSSCVTLSTSAILVAVMFGSAFAQDAKPEKKQSDEQAKSPSEVAATATTSPSTSTKSTTTTTASTPKHVALLKGGKTHTGLFTVHHKESKVFAELTAANYSKQYIVLISIARGIGQGNLLGGMSWGFGDDWVWEFRKIDNRVLIIRKNVRFKAKPGSRESYAVKNAYTDSVLYSLPILTKGPKGGDLIDLTGVFMSDLPQISQSLPGFSFSASKSLWESVKSFSKNLELQVAATYASSGRSNIESVADSRGVTVNVHYSISALPAASAYQPRYADDRVGYFLTVRKDYSKNSQRDQFLRYINRWKLEKDDPSAAVSSPKEPIIFWLEKTIPAKYRPAIQAGILEWNKAYEKAGFANAIEVRTQPVDADWDPEDINYNTFRWITSSAGFAMGPSRVNPYTGQILDADIIFDADFLTFWKEDFDTFTTESIYAMTGGPLDPQANPIETAFMRARQQQRCQLGSGMARQFAFGTTALMANTDPKLLAAEKEKFIMQGLKEVAMHEVGHTLGLRHNFKASTWRSLKQVNDPNVNGDSVASVMDYTPANIVPKEWKQGDYFPRTLGPYDYWAIEYGYKTLSGGTTGEVKELKKIASRSGEPGLAYATDEDTVSRDPDPLNNRFDHGSDALEYAKTRAQIVQELMPGLVDRMTEEGDDYVQARRAFNTLLSQQGQAMYFASRYVGGLYTHRNHKGDKNGKPPIEVIAPEKQREALKLLSEGVFNDKPFQFPPATYNFLGPSRWRHWGTSPTSRKDFPVHEYISMWQSRILDQLLAPVTLERIHDTELKIPAGEDAFTTAELIEGLTAAIYAEIGALKDGKYSNRQPAISSLRRNLQRIFLRELSSLAMGRTSAPDDCQTIAFAELMKLQGRIKKALKGKADLDSYSRAHLQETSSRIKKVLEADLSLARP